RRIGQRRTGGGFAAQNLEHHRATGRAFALDRLAPVFHRLFNAVGDFLLGFAFNAISFGHKISPAKRFMRRTGSAQSKEDHPSKQLRKAYWCNMLNTISLRDTTFWFAA